MHQHQLFPDHTEVILITATWDDIHGWHMAVTSKTQGAPWSVGMWVHYEQLSVGEMVDIAEQEIYKRA